MRLFILQQILSTFYLLNHRDDHYEGEGNDCCYWRDLHIDIDIVISIEKQKWSDELNNDYRRVGETELDNPHDKVGKVGHPSELLQWI